MKKHSSFILKRKDKTVWINTKILTLNSYIRVISYIISHLAWMKRLPVNALKELTKSKKKEGKEKRRYTYVSRYNKVNKAIWIKKSLNRYSRFLRYPLPRAKCNLYLKRTVREKRIISFVIISRNLDTRSLFFTRGNHLCKTWWQGSPFRSKSISQARRARESGLANISFLSGIVSSV